MKKTLLSAILAAAVPALAQESLQTVAPETLRGDAVRHFEVSTRIGVMGERDKLFNLGPAFQLEGRAAVPDTPLDVVFRGYYGQSDIKKGTVILDDGESGYSYTYRDIEKVTDGKAEVFGGSLQAQWNFARNAELNPYVAAGVVYEKVKFKDLESEEKMRLSVAGYGSAWETIDWGWYDWSEDGTAFVGRFGAEFNVAPFWFVAEASWMSALYDDDDVSNDDSQFELAGRAGWQFNDNCRVDAGIDYYTKWKQIFAGVGLTFAF